jgi:signal-transduction protein with cAMP-binding, CBS, and nucleotidyltransferase domain
MDLQRFGHAPPVACGTATPISDVAVLMHTHNVGSVVVLDDDGRLAGIVTDRDLVIRAMADGRDPNTAVSNVMTSDVLSLRADTPLFAAATEMATAGCRRMPVVDEQARVTGMITLDDLLTVFARQTEQLAQAVSSEIASGPRSEDTPPATERQPHVEHTIGAQSAVRGLVRREPVVVDPHTKLRTVAEILANEAIGVVVVRRERPDAPHGHTIGVVSERDITHAVARDMDLDTTPAVGVMTAELAYADPSDTVLRVAARMMANEIRHLPVTDGEELVGVISERDVLRVLVQALRKENRV